MAIAIPALANIKVEDPLSYTFQDLHLDVGRNDRFVGSAATRVPGIDIRVDYDELAIKNSLRNLFNTRKGQRFLFPEYGVDLYQYLFEPVTELNARAIGEDIISAIKLYEPRVVVLQVEVIAIPDDNTYEIQIAIQMPELQRAIEIYTNFELKSQSFVFFETSRNR